jgi:hypothetical protein
MSIILKVNYIKIFGNHKKKFDFLLASKYGLKLFHLDLVDFLEEKQCFLLDVERSRNINEYHQLIWGNLA